uniref:Pentacotripeptide-repeat region of PRORP domain-containing protein n=1 Tax=Opuntia streptacantha TaxID=393608 RepID=A0A7C9AIN7_OPUST
MILQSLLQSTSLPSTLSYSLSFPSGSALVVAPLPLRRGRVHHSIGRSSSISHSQVYSYRRVDYERRPIRKLFQISKRISSPESPGVASVLDQIEKEGRKFNKWELARVVKDLRKLRRYSLALQVYEWMNDGTERFRLSSSDIAIQLDLIAKVRGVSSAEDYFIRIPDAVKDKRIYCALLNAYARAKIRDKAEALMLRMRNKGYASHPLPVNVMMSLYKELNEHDKVEELVSEMRNKGIRMDLYSYNTWLCSRGSQGSAEGMEAVFRQMQSDSTVNPNWLTFSVMAGFYIKFGKPEKAEQFLKWLELRITRRDRTPYHSLISLYGSLGNKQEVYRVWNMYKSTFPTMTNWGYHRVISSLIKLGDIEGAEKIYEEWLSMKVSYDPKISNLLMSSYAKEGSFDKIKGFFDHMVKAGGKPNSASWGIFGVAHMKEGRISEALSCFKEAAFTNGAGNWKPGPTIISAFLELCEKEEDAGSKEIFVGLLRELDCCQDGSVAGESGGEVGNDFEQVMPDYGPADDETEEINDEESEMLPSFAE